MKYFFKSSLRKSVIFIITIFIYFTFHRINNNIQAKKYSSNNNHNEDIIIEQPHQGNFLINTPGCKIPNFHPFESEVKKFIKPPNLPVCNDGKPALLASNITSLYLISSSLSSYKITNTSFLICSYNGFFRAKPKIGESDTKIVFSGIWYNFTDSVKVGYEYVRTICYYNNVSIYNDMFSFVPTSNIKKQHAMKINHPETLNVLVLGLDSVSRLNLHRQLPKTVKYLQSLQAVELLGYNKVGDNTFPNLIPVLTGLSVEELNQGCLSKSQYYFDKCSFIWNHYKNHGYVTAYGEDAAHIGLFTYSHDGFRKQPTDFFYSYFSRYVESVIGNNHKANTYLCQGARYVYKDLLTYIKKFVFTMEENMLPFFAFFWEVSLSHDYLNLPNKGDQDYYEFFKTLEDSKILDNTAVIFMSDHGIRFGGIRQTYQGRIEERLPFVFILLPKWFKNTYQRGMNNLIENTARLTTPFDLHQTLTDLVYQENIPTESNSPKPNINVKSYSLFNKISVNRTCALAGIVSHWCTCEERYKISTNDSLVVKSVDFAVGYINQLLEDASQCSTLILSEILSATVLKNEEISFKEYMINFVTVPGDAVFEATVRHENKEMKVIGTVGRLNLYAGQSFCIDDTFLKMYCFCNEE